MEAELRVAKKSALRKRCVEAGFSEAALEGADDDEDSQEAFIRWLLKNSAGANESKLRAELGALKQSALRRRAETTGATDDELDAAEDVEDGNTKGALIDLIVQRELVASAADPAAQLREELAALKQSGLRKRALSIGVSEARLDAAYDEDDTKAKIIELIVGHSEAAIHEAIPPAHELKPHQGAPSLTRSADTKLAPEPAAAAGKHCMISYSWDDQAKAIKVRQAMQQRRVRTWMDIDGGMEADIYDSMAKGVNGASCVVALLSQSYHDSENCTLECKFAKECKVPIIPVYVQSGGWKASGWLGLLTAGALWVPYRDGEEEFPRFVESLMELVDKNAADTMLIEEVRNPTNTSARTTAERMNCTFSLSRMAGRVCRRRGA